MTADRKPAHRRTDRPRSQPAMVNRLWTDPWPWMRYTGVSSLGSLIVWFRVPKSERRSVLRGAVITMWLVLMLFVAVAIVVKAVSLLIH